MQEMKQKLDRLLAEAEDCELIGRLATDAEKRAYFRKLGSQLRAMAEDIRATMAARSGRSSGGDSTADDSTGIKPVP
jgi:hypothetical protein